MYDDGTCGMYVGGSEANVTTNNKHCLITRDHSFLRQIFRNSVGRFAKFRGSPQKIVPIPRPVTMRTFVSNYFLTFVKLFKG